MIIGGNGTQTDIELREALLKFRGSIAHKNGGKPYAVFNDAEMESLLLVRPKTISDLVKIKGFPSDGTRVLAYGKRICEIFSDNIPTTKMTAF